MATESVTTPSGTGPTVQVDAHELLAKHEAAEDLVCVIDSARAIVYSVMEDVPRSQQAILFGATRLLDIAYKSAISVQFTRARKAAYLAIEEVESGDQGALT